MAIQNKNKIKLGIFAGVAVFFFSFQISQASDISKENVINLVNQSRIKEGLTVLAENSKLNQAAMEKARDMFQYDYFAHTSPDNVTPWFWFEKNNYNYQYAGENLAINFSNAENQHQAWMKSADHKKNILNAKFQEIGVAVETGKINNQSTIITVQMFGARDDFKAVLGQPDYNNSLALLNQEITGDSKASIQDKNSVEKIFLSAENGFNSDRKYRIDFFEGMALVLLLTSVAVNPLVAGWLIIRKRKSFFQIPVAYSIKLAAIK